MGQIAEYVSPRGGCEAAIVREIQRARSGLAIAIFSFTSAPIAAALVAAIGKGVTVSIIADPSAQLGTGAKLATVAAAGAIVLIDSKHHLMHDKYMIVDGARVVTGSFNWTYDAEHANAENLLVIGNKKLAGAYLANWQSHFAHSARMALGS